MASSAGLIVKIFSAHRLNKIVFWPVMTKIVLRRVGGLSSGDGDKN